MPNSPWLVFAITLLHKVIASLTWQIRAMEVIFLPKFTKFLKKFCMKLSPTLLFYQIMQQCGPFSFILMACQLIPALMFAWGCVQSDSILGNLCLMSILFFQNGFMDRF